MPCGTLSSGVGAGQYLAIDKFVDTNGTALTSHTPNLGPAWQADTGADPGLTIQSNQATKAVSGQNGNAVKIDRASDFTAQVDWIPSASDAGTTAECFLLLRSDANFTNGFEIILEGDGTFAIATKFGASFTVRASAALGNLTAGARYTIKASFAGDTLTATVNGGNTLTYTDSTNNTNGFYQNVILNSTSANQMAVQNFQITSP